MNKFKGRPPFAPMAKPKSRHVQSQEERYIQDLKRNYTERLDRYELITLNKKVLSPKMEQVKKLRHPILAKLHQQLLSGGVQ
ncbi:hypothetical protein E3983_05460 [Legionella israelensis]|uniref:DUF465 domain-containing protein n=1 Tax=Legionella israelensis TaxID=454 RepID=A0AAX1EFM3_9GAMM|nr:hypothetical protein [Legionella israelensis]QBR83842.1 hypothetical protein E3983_05460 [Legionella israelensis]